jgi:hypothetical protein
MSSMDTGILDIAIPASTDAGVSSGSTTVDASVTSPTVDTNIDTSTVDSAAVNNSEPNVDETSSLNEDGTERTPEQTAEQAILDDKKMPVEARKLLKGLREANPGNQQVSKLIKDIHTQYERSRAYQEVFPDVKAARDTKAFLAELVGAEPNAPVTLQQAREAYAHTLDVINNVNESDQLLYAGDGALIKNIYEDMKSEGVAENFAKLATPYLETLKANDTDGYYKAITPHIVSELSESGFPSVLSRLISATKGTDAAKVVSGLVKWWNDSVDKVQAQSQGPSEEAQKLQKERETFEKTKAQEFQQSVGTEAAKSANQLLGKELAPFLKSAYFKGFGKENLRPLARTIQENLYSELENDKAYKTQMKALWSGKNPDKAKILQYQRVKIESIAGRIVRDVVQKMYPDHARGGSAAGRVAAAKAKADAQAKADATQKSQAAGGTLPQAQYVPVKPKNINREMDKNSLLEIAGRGYIPNGSGGWRLITWRKS